MAFRRLQFVSLGAVVLLFGQPFAGSTEFRRDSLSSVESSLLLGATAAARAAAPNVVRVNVAGGSIDIKFEPGEYPLGREVYVRWVTTAARAVTRYYGKFPVRNLLVRLSSARGSSVAFSTAGFEGDQPVIEIPIGRKISVAKLFRSWEATHEMVHLAFPQVDREDKWLKEGMATYIEPIARMQVNDLSPSKVWGDLFDSLPDGLAENDSGLKDASSIDRIYWGGAIFCLVADCEIRKQTRNQKGLQDALAAIPAAGGNFESEWSTLQSLRTGDRTIGVKVLEPLYLQMHNRPLRVNLANYFNQLGVRKVGGQIVFDDSAPLAAIRRSINTGGPHFGI